MGKKPLAPASTEETRVTGTYACSCGNAFHTTSKSGSFEGVVKYAAPQNLRFGFSLICDRQQAPND